MELEQRGAGRVDPRLRPLPHTTGQRFWTVDQKCSDRRSEEKMRRVQLRRRRREELMLVRGHFFLMVVPVGEETAEIELLRRMPELALRMVMREGEQPKTEGLRKDGGEQEKSADEALARRHAQIVDEPRQEDNRSRGKPTAGAAAPKDPARQSAARNAAKPYRDPTYRGQDAFWDGVSRLGARLTVTAPRAA